MFYGTPVHSKFGESLSTTTKLHNKGRVDKDEDYDLLYRSSTIDSIVQNNDEWTPKSLFISRSSKAKSKTDSFNNNNNDISQFMDKQDWKFFESRVTLVPVVKTSKGKSVSNLFTENLLKVSNSSDPEKIAKPWSIYIQTKNDNGDDKNNNKSSEKETRFLPISERKGVDYYINVSSPMVVVADKKRHPEKPRVSENEKSNNGMSVKPKSSQEKAVKKRKIAMKLSRVPQNYYEEEEEGEEVVQPLKLSKPSTKTDLKFPKFVTRKSSSTTSILENCKQEKTFYDGMFIKDNDSIVDYIHTKNDDPLEELSHISAVSSNTTLASNAQKEKRRRGASRWDVRPDNETDNNVTEKEFQQELESLINTAKYPPLPTIPMTIAQKALRYALIQNSKEEKALLFDKEKEQRYLMFLKYNSGFVTIYFTHPEIKQSISRIPTRDIQSELDEFVSRCYKDYEESRSKNNNSNDDYPNLAFGLSKDGGTGIMSQQQMTTDLSRYLPSKRIIFTSSSGTGEEEKDSQPQQDLEQTPTRTVEPWVPNPLLIKRFGISLHSKSNKSTLSPALEKKTGGITSATTNTTGKSINTHISNIQTAIPSSSSYYSQIVNNEMFENVPSIVNPNINFALYNLKRVGDWLFDLIFNPLGV